MPHRMTRRRLLLGAAASAGAPSAEPAGQPPSLAEAARRAGRDYGAAVRMAYLRNDAAYRQAVLFECATLTPEIELKWAAVEPRRGELSLADMDDLADLARAQDKRLEGHTLLWGRSIPDWARPGLAQRGGWNAVQRYVDTVMPRYADVAARWDVVNEPIAEDEGVDGLRAGPFLAAFGPDYIRRALETARGAVPGARLAINDFGFERDTPREEARRRRLLRLLDALARVGAPLDAVGLQSHLDLGVKRLPQSRLAAFLKEIADRGLAIHVTELDVKERDYPLPPARRDARVAQAVRSYLDVVLDQPAVRGVSTWGLTDRYSWLQVAPADLARFPRDWRDGSSPGLNRGLPLDSDLRPKPMREAILAAFAAARKSARRPII